ncbi:hypothetical protein SynBIOSE41_02369 [Synechococcus sp. BIOS-E4-1]|nr:hypothetical protein SynBIOSE41_02369 [Synechococcus sp. BIOS-E4-1]
MLMQPFSEDTRRSFPQLLLVTAGPALVSLDEELPVEHQIDPCIEITKAEASEGAALVDACAPHVRAMLTQAQKRLENLQALKVLHAVSRESFGSL